MQSAKHKPRFNFSVTISAAAITLLAVAAAFLVSGKAQSRCLTLRNARTGELYASYPVQSGDWFGVGFVHSVNKSPLTDYYEIKDDGIYVQKTVYDGFGAGVQTELEPGQVLTYREDGSMEVSGFDLRMDDLTYFVGTVSDHTLTLNDGEGISLRDLCGRSARVRFACEQLWFWEK